MVAKKWLIKKLKRELLKAKVLGYTMMVPYFLTWLLKFIPILENIHYYFEAEVMYCAMSSYDTGKSIRDCESYDIVMGVSQDEYGKLYDGRSEEEKRRMSY